MEKEKLQTLTNVIAHLKDNDLKTVFNVICDEYARRLCKMYEWHYEDCFWVADLRAGTFCSSDIEYSLSLEDVILLVENNLPFEEFQKWWDYNMLINYAQSNHPFNNKYNPINLWSWINGFRPTVSKSILEKEEQLYWKNIKVADLDSNDESEE